MNNNSRHAVINNVDVEDGATIYDHVNLYGCKIGANTKIDAFVYIEEDVEVGKDCTIRPFVFIPTGVKINDGVFVGPGVTFTNDRYPNTSGEWELETTTVEEGAGIGAGVTVLPGVTIGKNSIVGAGSVVTKDVPPGKTVVGNPARVVSKES